MLAILLISSPIVQSYQWTPPTYNETVWKAFAAKTLLNPLPPISEDPYSIKNFNTT
jgi:hypothetical protein